MKAKHRNHLGLSVWEAICKTPKHHWFPLLWCLEQRAKRDANLEALRGIRECRAMLVEGELPARDERSGENPLGPNQRRELRPAGAPRP